MAESAEIYAEFVLSRIKKELEGASLTDEQISAIRRTLIADRVNNQHSVDIRISIPLIFRKYYILFFLGRDRRAKTLELERLRYFRLYRRILRSITLLALFLLSVCVAGVAFIGLYRLKVALGIDIFPSFHLSDVVPWV